jgi:hypothetical protein
MATFGRRVTATVGVAVTAKEATVICTQQLSAHRPRGKERNKRKMPQITAGASLTIKLFSLWQTIKDFVTSTDQTPASGAIRAGDYQPIR